MRGARGQRRAVAPVRAAFAFALGVAAGGCHDGLLLHEPAPPGPAHVAVEAVVLHDGAGAAAGGIAEAYGRVDAIAVTFLVGEAVRLQATLPFDPSGAESRVPIDVPLEEGSETFTLVAELRRGADPLFRGAAQVVLSAGASNAVEVPLQPVLARVTCAGPLLVLDAYGATARLTAAGLFATDDTIPGVVIGWSSANAAVATVDAAGTVTAVADGDATVQCNAAGVADTRAVRVAAVVTSVQVTPQQVSVGPGGSQAFSAVLRDRLGNALTGRTVTWTSSNPSVATVSATGVATAIAAGTTTITASSGGITAAATLTVQQQPPTGTTVAASGVGPAGATLNGVVNPRGAPTQAWFEWGTSPLLSSFSVTPALTLSGTSDVPVSHPLTQLQSNVTYYYRVAASNTAGVVRGSIASFTTALSPSVTTQQASPSVRTAILAGLVNPNGSATDVWFEWGPTPQPSSFVPTPPSAIGSGRTNVSVTAQVTGLTEDTDYYYRIVARNAAGTSAGQVLGFRTGGGGAPIAVTLGSEIEDSTYTTLIVGLVNPNGAASMAYFMYSPDSTFTDPYEVYTTQATTLPASAQDTVLREPVYIDNWYGYYEYVYYRIIAVNQYGTTYGNLLAISLDADGMVAGRPGRPAAPPQPVRRSSGGDTDTGFDEPGTRPRSGGQHDDNGDRS